MPMLFYRYFMNYITTSNKCATETCGCLILLLK